MERFLSQPFHVAEAFTGTPGTYVPIEETIRGFKEIIEGKHDDVPESAFFLKGSIDDVVKESKGAQEDDSGEGDDERRDDGPRDEAGGDEQRDEEQRSGEEDEG